MADQEKSQQVVESNDQDIPSLKSKIQEINSKKEEWFKKKEELNKQIGDIITSLKKINPEINEAKNKERELLQKRNEHNKKFHEFLTKSKELVKGRNILEEKFGRGVTPDKLKERINKLEFSIETEALSMTKEKKIMDQINSIRRILGEVGPMANYRDEMKSVSETINNAKAESEKCHNELRELQKVNRIKFKEYLFNSKKVNQLKKQQREAFKNFVSYKSEFLKLSNMLKQKLALSGKVIHESNKKQKNKKQYNNDSKRIKEDFIDKAKIIEENVKRVEKKLKETKKLTTQDIIALQGIDDKLAK